MHIAIITAGGAGMFCGSCMHDNTLARALIEIGEQVSLIPTYTPIRVDETDVSDPRVLLGGINVYLDAKLPFWRRLPRSLTHWLDAPTIINFATSFGVSSDAKKLGKMTIALLKGDAGPQQLEVDNFAHTLARELKPDVICFSNALLVGTLERLKQQFDNPVYCLLQGDDIFLENLLEPFRSQALELIRTQARQFDGFLVHSGYYRDFMSEYLHIPPKKIHVVPLGIDLTGHDGQPAQSPHKPFTVGYFARICPEKGLHLLVDGFRKFHAKHPDTRLVAGGYLGTRDKAYFKKVTRAAADLGTSFEYIGSPPGHVEKVAFLKSLDVLSVPTEYREPKGLYVLEALANGVPVVQPRHGAFPELLEATKGGLLFSPGSAEELTLALERLYLDAELRHKLAIEGQKNVQSLYNPRTMAEATLSVLSRPNAS